MDEMDIRFEARLQALEYVLCDVYAGPLRAEPDLISIEKQRQQELLARFDHYTVPGVDPVVSDTMAAEMKDAVERLLNLILELAENR